MMEALLGQDRVKLGGVAGGVAGVEGEELRVKA